MTMRSLLATLSWMSRSTWNWPYHLLTPSNEMIGVLSAMFATSRVFKLLAAHADVEITLDPAAVARQRKAAHEVHRGHEELPLEEELAPVGIAERELQRAGQVVQADDGDQRGVLEGADEAVDDGRHHQAQRLWQHDLARGLPVGEPKRLRRLDLALGQRL